MAMAATFKLYLPKVSRDGCGREVETAASRKLPDAMNKTPHEKRLWQERKIQQLKMYHCKNIQD